MDLPRVMGCDLSGVWHLTRATYPATMDTACGKEQEPACLFSTDGNPDVQMFERCECAIPSVSTEPPSEALFTSMQRRLRERFGIKEW